jgi:hypothetical protein
LEMGRGELMNCWPGLALNLDSPNLSIWPIHMYFFIFHFSISLLWTSFHINIEIYLLFHCMELTYFIKSCHLLNLWVFKNVHVFCLEIKFLVCIKNLLFFDIKGSGSWVIYVTINVRSKEFTFPTGIAAR